MRYLKAFLVGAIVSILGSILLIPRQDLGLRFPHYILFVAQMGLIMAATAAALMAVLVLMFRVATRKAGADSGFKTEIRRAMRLFFMILFAYSGCAAAVWAMLLFRIFTSVPRI